MIREVTIGCGLMCALAMFSGCGGSSSAPSTLATSPPAAAAVAVSIPAGARTLGTSSYVPNPITLAAGSTITWTNTDTISHTSTSTDTGAVFDSGTIPAGGKFSFVFPTKGTFSYHCSFHAGMIGTIVVQ
jgi:plastocyanin